MTRPVRRRVATSRYPRLTWVIVGGLAAVGLGVLTFALRSTVPALSTTLAVRLFVLGYLLVLFGAAGYLALVAGDRLW